MLYSKNKQDKKLDIELFKNPTSDYREKFKVEGKPYSKEDWF